MMALSDLTPDDINRMSYNELIGIVRETNRPPGGRRSVHEIAARCFLRPESRVLDVGTSTGFTAIELARTVGCEIVGVDINEESLEEARRRARRLGLSRISFIRGDAHDLAFEDRSFDLVIAGNLVSLVPDPSELLSQLVRLLSANGCLALTPMYYIQAPPVDLVADVGKAIKVELAPRFRAEALRTLRLPDCEVVYSADFEFEEVTEDRIADFCQQILSRSHLESLLPRSRDALREVYLSYMKLFARNLSHMGFTILILRPGTTSDDPELFSAVAIPAGVTRNLPREMVAKL
ncbi:MAG: class I SAM-dependent methyltransferase [Acidobacteria bacterium]|nr:class I SAM-dependent methyltransferase [Acidobacteriota bacterium]